MEKEVKQLWDKFRPFIKNMDLDINTKGRVIIIKLAHLEVKKEFRGRKIAYQIIVNLLDIAFKFHAFFYLKPAYSTPHNNTKLYNLYHKRLGLTSAIDKEGFLFYYF